MIHSYLAVFFFLRNNNLMNKFPYYLHLEHQTYRKLKWLDNYRNKPEVFSTNYEEQLSYKRLHSLRIRLVYVVFLVSSRGICKNHVSWETRRVLPNSSVQLKQLLCLLFSLASTVNLKHKTQLRYDPQL